MNPPTIQSVIRIFPDFGGFTHRIVYPADYQEHPGKYPSSSELVPPSLEARLEAWQREFERYAWDDYSGKHGSMLWIAFDLEGIKISKQIKKHVGIKARVIYQKPFECPYHMYDANREVLANGELVTLNDQVGEPGR